MKKLLIKILVSIVVLIAVVLIFRNPIIKMVAGSYLNSKTGLELQIDELDVAVLSNEVKIKGLHLYNPPEFPDKNMVDLPEVYVKYDLASMLTGKPHIKHLKFNLEQFTVVNTKEGSNLDRFKAFAESKQKQEVSQEEAPKEGEAQAKAAKPELKIDKFDLRLNRVVMKDYTKNPDKPRIVELNMNLKRQYTDIDDPASLAFLIMGEVTMNTAVNSLLGNDLFKAVGVNKAGQQVLDKASDLLQGTGKAANKVKGLLNALPFGE